MSALQRAIEAAGGASKLAAAIGVTAQRLSNWIDRGVPAERCPDIERAVGGVVRCEELRPDVSWSVLRGAPPIRGIEPQKQLDAFPPEQGVEVQQEGEASVWQGEERRQNSAGRRAGNVQTPSQPA